MPNDGPPEVRRKKRYVDPPPFSGFIGGTGRIPVVAARMEPDPDARGFLLVDGEWWVSFHGTTENSFTEVQYVGPVPGFWGRIWWTALAWVVDRWPDDKDATTWMTDQRRTSAPRY